MLSFLFYFLVLHAAAHLPLFDSSSLFISSSPLIRWDVLHFIHLSYLYEHQWAFSPAIRLVLLLDNPWLYYAFMAILVWDTHQVLRSLSLYHLRSPKVASLAATLSLIPTSPVTLYFAPYNEPFCTYFGYRGMLFCTRKQWFKACICFALASCFRSNGIFLSGFILWGLLVQPFITRKMPKWQHIIKATIYTAVILAPFIAHHIVAYLVFCSGENSSEIPEWCSRIPPSLYTHVQTKYWDNGFLRYWTLNQLPNFLISAPTISLITAFCIHHLTLALAGPKTAPGSSHPFQNPSITPHAIHALVLTSILVFSSNVQIILRLAASMPIVYWAAAWLLLEHPKLGRLWVVWSVLWSIISTILWATFLPPA